MQATHCPICYTALEVCEVAPCADCGNHPNEIMECAAGEHRYAEYRIFGEYHLVLCDFCDADFGSYYAGYFGLPGQGLIPDDSLEFRHDVSLETQPRYDKVCPECQQRLAFLEFRAAAIAKFSKDHPI